MNFHITNISTYDTFCVTQFRGIVASFTPEEYWGGRGAGGMGLTKSIGSGARRKEKGDRNFGLYYKV